MPEPWAQQAPSSWPPAHTWEFCASGQRHAGDILLPAGVMVSNPRMTISDCGSEGLLLPRSGGPCEQCHAGLPFS